jgi:Icc protein
VGQSKGIFVKLLLLTDIHLTRSGVTICDRDPDVNFEKALRHAMAHHADAEALIISGDLSDLGEEADYFRLKSMLKEVTIPVHLCIGNHDDRETMVTTFPDCTDKNGFVQKLVPLSNGHAILLDSWGKDSHAGHFCQARASWLTEQLAILPGPIWIFLHHHIVPTGVPALDRIILLDADRLGECLAPHKDKIAHIFHGHCHLPLAGTFQGIPFYAPRGTNHACWPDFVADKSMAADLPESYAVIVSKNGDTMINTIEYGYQGIIRKESDW